MFFFGPAIGKFYDNHGPRYLLLAGAFLEVFGLMMTSLASAYYQFRLAQGLCSSIGASMVFYAGMSPITTWFFEKRAFAFGIMAAGSSLGGVIFPITVQRLIVSVGFGWSMRCAAFLVLFMLAIANVTVTSRMPPSPTPLDLMEFVVPFKELPFDLTCLGSFLFFLGMFLPINYIIVEAQHFGMSDGLAQYLVPILNAASLFGRTIPGFLADKIGRFNMMVIMTFFTGMPRPAPRFLLSMTFADHQKSQASWSSPSGSLRQPMRPSSSSPPSSASAAAPSSPSPHHSLPKFLTCARSVCAQGPFSPSFR